MNENATAVEEKELCMNIYNYSKISIPGGVCLAGFSDCAAHLLQSLRKIQNHAETEVQHAH